MSALTWCLDPERAKASAIGHFGIYVVKGVAGPCWTAAFVRFRLYDGSDFPALPADGYLLLREALRACENHADACDHLPVHAPRIMARRWD